MEYRVMLIEDDTSIAKLLAAHIEKYRYQCVINKTINGKEGC